MKRSAAASKEAAYIKNRRLNRIAYRVSSIYKGCGCCGEWTERVSTNGRTWKAWTIPGDVWRAYSPSSVGWTYWCYACGAKDSQAWEGANDIGLDAIRGPSKVVRELKKERLSQYRLSSGEVEVKVVRPNADRELIEKVKALIAQIKGQ